MKWKKGNTLANELIDDLLDEESSEDTSVEIQLLDEDSDSENESLKDELVNAREVSTEEPAVARYPDDEVEGFGDSSPYLVDEESEIRPEHTLIGQGVVSDSEPNLDLSEQDFDELSKVFEDGVEPESDESRTTVGEIKNHAEQADLTERNPESHVVQDDRTAIVDPGKSTEVNPKDIADEMKMPEVTVKTAIGRAPSSNPTKSFIDVPASLSQSEALRIAQQKITNLENEIERLREENESLAAAGEAITKRTDELMAKLDHVESLKQMLEDRFGEEKQTLLDTLSMKEKEIDALKLKEEEFEMRLSSNIRKIRVRERELENRLELVKLEGTALLRNKDEMILELKRQLDHLTQEMEGFRTKGQELSKQLSTKQDMLHRTVKALRIALSMLEGELENVPGGKGKAS